MSTVLQECECTVLQQYECTVLQQYECTVLQQYECTVLQQYECTLLLQQYDYECTVLQQCECTVLQQYECLLCTVCAVSLQSVDPRIEVELYDYSVCLETSQFGTRLCQSLVDADLACLHDITEEGYVGLTGLSSSVQEDGSSPVITFN